MSASRTLRASSRAASSRRSRTRRWAPRPSPSLSDRKVSVANAEMKVSFLAPVRAGMTLRCEAVVVAGGSRTAFVEASITDEDGPARGPGLLDVPLQRPKLGSPAGEGRWRRRWSPFKKGAPCACAARTRDTTTLVRDYLVQETVDPLRTLGRCVACGHARLVLRRHGDLMLLVALLRLLQDETGAFDGNLSWIPYLIVTVVAAVVIAAHGAADRDRARAAQRRPRPSKETS